MASSLTLGLVIGTIGTAVAHASIPDGGSGKIHGCYETGVINKGNLRIIDAATDSCGGSEEAITWNTASTGTLVSDLTASNFAEADIRYRNFEGTDLSNSDFSHASAVGANFSHTNLTNSIFTGSASPGFSKTKFIGADLTGSNVTSFQIQGVDFTGSKLKNLIMSPDTDFQLGNFTDVDFSGSNLLGLWDMSNYTNAKMNDLTLDSVSLSSSNMSGTDFTNTHFISTQLQYSDLSSAILTGATWTNTTCPDTTNSNDNGDTCLGHLTP